MAKGDAPPPGAVFYDALWGALAVEIDSNTDSSQILGGALLPFHVRRRRMSGFSLDTSRDLQEEESARLGSPSMGGSDSARAAHELCMPVRPNVNGRIPSIVVQRVVQKRLRRLMPHGCTIGFDHLAAALSLPNEMVICVRCTNEGIFLFGGGELDTVAIRAKGGENAERGAAGEILRKHAHMDADFNAKFGDALRDLLMIAVFDIIFVALVARWGHRTTQNCLIALLLEAQYRAWKDKDVHAASVIMRHQDLLRCGIEWRACCVFGPACADRKCGV